MRKLINFFKYRVLEKLERPRSYWPNPELTFTYINSVHNESNLYYTIGLELNNLRIISDPAGMYCGKKRDVQVKKYLSDRFRR